MLPTIAARAIKPRDRAAEIAHLADERLVGLPHAEAGEQADDDGEPGRLDRLPAGRLR